MRKSLVFLGSLVLGLCGVAHADLNDGLIAYYPFNGNANDESGNGNDGVVNGAVLTTDRFAQENSAYFFDGNDYVSMGNPASLRLSEDFTISSWALFTSHSGADRILSFNQESGYELGIWNGSPWFAYANKNHIANQVLQPNTWFHLTVTKAGSLIRIYLNGELILEDTNNNTPSFSRELRFGQKSQSDSWWSGKIDGTRFYNRSFTQNEVKILVNGGPLFQIIEGNFTWHEAKADADARGGRLAVLDTQQKIDAANEYLQRNEFHDNTWIGLTDENKEGDWEWITGDSLTASNWRSGEPNNIGDEDYAYITRSDRTWADTKSSASVGNYLLEIIDNTPSPPLLLLEPLYESPTGEIIEISAVPSFGVPFDFTYQWYFNGFQIPPALGGTQSSISIDNLPSNEGTWSVIVTNETGSREENFEFRIYSDQDTDGLSDAYEELVSFTDFNDPDSDADGLRDGEEVYTYHTNPSSSDTDSDGFTDLYELETAYNPNSSASFPDAQVDIMTAIEVHFNAALGANYSIEFSSDSENWLVIENNIIGEGSVEERFYSRRDFPKGFFRVVRTDQ